ncbi:MAG: ATP-binding cassette domain-containing protein [Lachnospiraceae bacterium]|nr:ATP-binding cassette domain-containing protein [Lachnospiraceae bacterium]
MEVLRAENLNFVYPDGKQALTDISISLGEGEMMCVCGPTGSGKSTLLRLLKRELSPRGERSGSIYISGRRQEELGDREAATQVGFVMQRPDMQIVTDKVWHELAFGLENLGVGQGEIRRRVCEIAGYFGMEEWFDKSTDSLSGGQKQLLNLASVMVMQPRILILDEPVSQLDPIAASDFIATLGKLAREFGISIIAAEQRLEELVPVSDKLLAIKDGRIAAFGDTRECVERLVSDETFAPYMPAAARLFAKLADISKEFCDACGYGAAGKNASMPDSEITETGVHIKPGVEEKLCEEENPCTEGRKQKSRIPLSVGEGRRFLRDTKNIFEEEKCLTARSEGKYDSELCDARTEKTEGIRKDSKVGSAKESQNASRETALEFREVYLSYERTGKDVLRSLSLKVMKGEIFCIVGGNGAGKSTAVCAAAGLVRPYSGKIKVFGKNIRDYKGQELYRECVALLPQDVQTVFLTDDINGRHPYDLSGGEQQLAALDIVLATKPKLLLLDEPTKGLDVSLAESLCKKLKGLAAAGTTIVVVSHDVEFASAIADRCALLFNGEIVSVCESRAFFAGNYFYTTALNRLLR